MARLSWCGWNDKRYLPCTPTISHNKPALHHHRQPCWPRNSLTLNRTFCRGTLDLGGAKMGTERLKLKFKLIDHTGNTFKFCLLTCYTFKSCSGKGWSILSWRRSLLTDGQTEQTGSETTFYTRILEQQFSILIELPTSRSSGYILWVHFTWLHCFERGGVKH